MIVGFYTGASAVDYNEQKLAAVTNNLANQEKPSYKASDFVIRTRKVRPETRWINPMVLKRLPPLYGVERKGVYKDFESTPPVRETNNPLNIAIDPSLKNAFFAVKDGNNPQDSETFYTRNGQLQMGFLDPENPSSLRVLKSGSHILLNDQGAPIEVAPDLGPLDIDKEGAVYQGDVLIGQLPLYKFNKSPDPNQVKDSNLQSLIRLGDSLYQVPPKLKQEFNPVQLNLQDSASGVLVRQGFLEGSNVDMMSEMMSLMTVNRSSQAGRAAMEQQVGSLEKLFQIVRS